MLGVSVALSSMLDEEEQAFPKMSFGEGPDKAGTLFIAVVPNQSPLWAQQLLNCQNLQGDESHFFSWKLCFPTPHSPFTLISLP